MYAHCAVYEQHEAVWLCAIDRRGCITAAIFVVVATVLFAFLTTLFDISEAACMNVQAAVGIIGVFLGGLAAGRTNTAEAGSLG